MSAAHEIAAAVRIASGQVLRELRDERRVTQEALADALGFDRTYPSLLERGLRQPTLAALLVLAQGLGVSPCELVGRVAERLEREGWLVTDRSLGGARK
jgi:transcriptional regulator with XRE-family HTH domain